MHQRGGGGPVGLRRRPAHRSVGPHQVSVNFMLSLVVSPAIPRGSSRGPSRDTSVPRGWRAMHQRGGGGLVGLRRRPAHGSLGPHQVSVSVSSNVFKFLLQ